MNFFPNKLTDKYPSVIHGAKGILNTAFLMTLSTIKAKIPNIVEINIANILSKKPVQNVVTKRSLISPAPRPFVTSFTKRRTKITNTAPAKFKNILAKSVETFIENTVIKKEKISMFGINPYFRSLKEINPK